MTSAVAGAAAKGAAKGGGSFQGGKAMGIEKPPPGHFDTPDAAPSAPAPTKSSPAKKSTPPKKQPDPAPPAKQESGGLTIGPPKPPPGPQVPSVVNTGAGFLLGLMFWTWVALPFLNGGGVVGVKNQLRAKFLNKAPDGSWLP